jgi:hypothetical protein
MRLAVTGVAIAASIALAALGNAVDPLVGRVGAPPTTLTPGRPWTATFHLSRGGRKLTWLSPRLTISQGSDQRDFVAHTSRPAGTYEVRVIFPTAGRWVYRIRVGADTAAKGTVTVHTGPVARNFLAPGGQ